jgi:hypothetical protein
MKKNGLLQIFFTIFENSRDELGTGNTHHFQSIVNDESDER